MSRKRKGKKNFPRQMQTRSPQPAARVDAPTVAQEPKLNLSHYYASTVVLREYKLLQIILAGAGGIGAYMAQHIGRLMIPLYEMDKGVQLTICDPDVVKEENRGRQLFCKAELGEPKAVCLARRYGQAWGLNTMAYVGDYSENLLIGADLTILVGCVDNATARNLLAATLEHNPSECDPEEPPSILWLDCGNLKDSGRVQLGTAPTVEQMRGAFLDKKRVMSLPSPVIHYPDLLIPTPEERQPRITDNMTCAQRAAANLQSLNINACVASIGADFLARLLITGDLKCFEVEVNLASYSTKPYHTTPEEVAGVLDKPASYVLSGEAKDAPMPAAAGNQPAQAVAFG